MLLTLRFGYPTAPEAMGRWAVLILTMSACTGGRSSLNDVAETDPHTTANATSGPTTGTEICSDGYANGMVFVVDAVGGSWRGYEVF